MRPLFACLIVCLPTFHSQAQKAPPAPTEFAVLQTDSVDVRSGESTHVNCSITGTGDAAQLSCDSETGSGVPLVYHVALVVGSNHVGYVVSCGGGLVWQIHCRALSAGQVLKGSVQGGKLSVSLDGKNRSYRIETSAYIGPLGGKPSTRESPSSSPPASSPSEEPSAEPSVKRAVQVERSGDAGSNRGAQGDQSGPLSNVAKVMVSSEPSGADIYVDENFMGNTPSLLQLEAGSHAIRIEAKGRKTWSRALSLTAGGKVTVQAALDAEQ
jgi:hypothetical protein